MFFYHITHHVLLAYVWTLVVMKKHVLDRNSRVRNYIRYLMTNSSYIIIISDTKCMLNTFILFFSEQWYPVEYQHYDCDTHGYNIINIIAHHPDKEDRTFFLVLHTPTRFKKTKMTHWTVVLSNLSSYCLIWILAVICKKKRLHALLNKMQYICYFKLLLTPIFLHM